MDFFQSTWFTVVCAIIIFGSIFANLWLSFVDESGTEPSEAISVLLKIIFFIPMVIVGLLLIAIERKAWGAIVFVLVLATFVVIAWINDPGESPVAW